MAGTLILSVAADAAAAAAAEHRNASDDRGGPSRKRLRASAWMEHEHIPFWFEADRSGFRQVAYTVASDATWNASVTEVTL